MFYATVIPGNLNWQAQNITKHKNMDVPIFVLKVGQFEGKSYTGDSLYFERRTICFNIESNI